jgi:two-component system CheB/CheR fusion protein
LLLHKKLDEAKTEQALSSIERAAQAQNLLIMDLLDVSRISSGTMRLDAQPVKLISVISAAMEVVNLSAEAKNIQIQSRLNPSSKTVVGDPIRLNR